MREPRATFRPQLQTKFGGCDAPFDEVGDCFSACVASILDVDLADVPNFCAYGDTWAERANAWLRPRGLFMLHFDGPDRSWMPAHALSIASGPAARGHRHCCVYDGSGLVHDPHPSGAGLESVEVHDLFVLLVEKP